MVDSHSIPPWMILSVLCQALAFQAEHHVELGQWSVSVACTSPSEVSSDSVTKVVAHGHNLSPWS